MVRTPAPRALAPSRSGWVRCLVRLAAVGLLVVPAGCGDDVSVTSDRSRVDSTEPVEIGPDTTPLPMPSTSTSVPAPPTAPPTLPPVTPAPSTIPGSSRPADPPAGAIELGLGVFVPVPDGWALDSSDETGVILTDGVANHVAFEVHARPAGEDPLLLMQQYVDSFDADFDAVSYGPMVEEPRRQLDPPITQYRAYYTTFDPDRTADGVGLSGAVYVIARGDGLSVVADIWTDVAEAVAGDVSFPIEASDALEESLSAAPLLGSPGPLPARGPVRLQTVHPEALVDDLHGFTVVPGFEVIDSRDGLVKVSNGTREFEVQLLGRQSSVDAALAEAERVAVVGYVDVEWDGVTEFAPDEYGLERRVNTFNATWAADGEHAGAIVEAVFDPLTSRALIMIDDFYWDGGDLPFEPEVRFMRWAMGLSVDHID